MFDYNYEYSLDGNQTKKQETVSGKSNQYVYDGMGRLQSETELLNGSQVSLISYTYDNYNNRATMTETKNGVSTTTAYVYDANNRLLTETKTTGDVQAITRYGYDNNGNQIYKGTESITPATSSTDTISAVVLGQGSDAGNVTINEYDGLN